MGRECCKKWGRLEWPTSQQEVTSLCQLGSLPLIRGLMSSSASFSSFSPFPLFHLPLSISHPITSFDSFPLLVYCSLTQWPPSSDRENSKNS